MPMNVNRQQKGAQQPQGGPVPLALPPLESVRAFMEGYVPPDYLIEDLIQRGRVYSLTAPTSHGKTAVALALAFAKAGGLEIAGRRVEPGRVVYLAAENPDDIKGRVILMVDRLKLNVDDLQLWFVPGAFNLAEGLEPLADYVKSIGGASFIVIDTGAAFLAASNVTEENNNLDVLRFALELRQLTKLPGNPAGLALMHPTKYAKREDLVPRGGGAFLNEMDGNLILWADEDRETTELHWTGKLRGPTFDPVTFALEKGTCPKLIDARGRPSFSVWAYATTSQRAEQAAARSKGDEDALLHIMSYAPNASFAGWAKALGWLLASGEPAKQRVQRAIARLQKDGLVSKKRDRWILTKTGKQEAANIENSAAHAADAA
jgi:AAA domain